MKKTIASAFLNLAAVSLTFASAAPVYASESLGDNTVEGTAVTEGEPDTELHIAINAAPSTLDCTLTSAVITRQIAYSNIFESLVTIRSDYTVAPELAESFEVSDDNTVYTYHLRKGVLFHNGQEMTADDVVASMNRWLENYGTARSVTGDAQFEKTDDYTVQITLDTPSIYLNELIGGAGNMPIIVPASALETLDEETGGLTEYIGTGPYRFDGWVTDQYIKLTRFEDYQPYGTPGEADGYAAYKEALIQDIYFDFVEDASTRAAGLLTGDYDYAALPTDNYDQFAGQEDYLIYKEVSALPALVYNKKTGLASDPKIRQAVNAVLNDEDIMLAAYADPNFFRLDGALMLQEQANWYTAAGTENYNLNDPEKAKELLEEAGYAGETFTILVSSAYQDFYNAAIIVQQELQEIGMDCQLDVCDWSTFLEKRADETAYDAFITSFSKNTLPTQISFFNPEWAGWASDQELLDGVAAFNSAESYEEAYAAWEALQSFALGEGQEVSVFGASLTYAVASAKINGLGYFQGPLIWNAVIYK